MQIMLLAILFIILIAFIIYKINNKFETKELIILIAILIICSSLTYFFLENEEQKVPQIFKTKYEKVYDAKIEKFSYERLNNKMVSSKTNFIYNFDYIVIKDKQEYVCSSKNVKVKKIEDEFIFENFEKLEEKCTKQ